MLVRHVLALTLGGVVAAGCGLGEAPPPGGPDDPGGAENARINPSVIHTGFSDGTTFQVPVSTDLSNFVSGDIDWSSESSAVLTIEPVPTPADEPPTRGTWAMITTAGAGTTTISGSFDEFTVEAEVIVAEYSAADVAAGEARYNDEGVDDRVACASCHLAAGGADHTPSEMAFHDDAALLLVATEGHYPDLCVTDEGESCECDSSGCTREPGYVLNLDHTWAFEADEMTGIVAYLRSLPPRGF